MAVKALLSTEVLSFSKLILIAGIFPAKLVGWKTW